MLSKILGETLKKNGVVTYDVDSLGEVEYSKELKSTLKELKSVLNQVSKEQVSGIKEDLEGAKEELAEGGLSDIDLDALFKVFPSNKAVRITLESSDDKEPEPQSPLSRILNDRIGNSTSTEKPKDTQIKYYLDMCRDRNIIPVNFSALNKQQLSTLIDKVKRHYPVSYKQRFMIVNSLVRLNKEIPSLDKLTAGRNGTASQFIENIIKYEKEVQHTLPPTEGQLGILIDMFICPDVPFESYGVEKIKELDGGEWRQLTQSEAIEELKVNLNKSSASELIENYKPAFWEWKKTRLTMGQLNRIKQLQERMESLHGPGFAKERVANMYGDEVDAIGDNNTREYAPQAYQPLNDMQLAQLTKKTAGQLIDQLSSELKNKELTKLPRMKDNELTFEKIRVASDMDKVDAEEFERINNIVHTLYASIGQQAEDDMLQACMGIYDMEVNSDVVKEYQGMIKELIRLVIEQGGMERMQIIEMAQDSAVLSAVLLA